MAIHERICSNYDRFDSAGNRLCHRMYARRYKRAGQWTYLCPSCAADDPALKLSSPPADTHGEGRQGAGPRTGD
jgi:hypothetical protein